MAVHVEDHPLDYGGFEGVIPPGQYGAGTVIVWDRGIWEPVGDPHEGYRQGKLKFDLYGEKLQGRWTLVRMHGRAGEKQEPWLLIKERDEAARPASEYNIVEELPDSVLGAGSKAKKPARKKTSKRARSKLALPAQARKAELPLTLSAMLATVVDEPPKRGEGGYEGRAATSLCSRATVTTGPASSRASRVPSTRCSYPTAGWTAKSWCRTTRACPTSRHCRTPSTLRARRTSCTTSSICPIATVTICAPCRCASAARYCNDSCRHIRNRACATARISTHRPKNCSMQCVACAWKA